MRRVLPWLVLAMTLSSGACRTRIAPYSQPPTSVVYVGDKQCNVHDFPGATDVPEGAKNLGWVSVKSTGNDEETFIKLREKICEMGGNGLSQAAWVREPGEYEPTTLKANAWELP